MIGKKDLVKSHLTTAVNQEIVFLKNQIKQLTEKCNRLEQENQILKKNALPETIAALIENRGATSSTSSIGHMLNTNPSNQSMLSSSLASQQQPAKSQTVVNNNITTNADLMSSSIYDNDSSRKTNHHQQLSNEPSQESMVNSFIEHNTNENFLIDFSANFESTASSSNSQNSEFDSNK